MTKLSGILCGAALLGSLAVAGAAQAAPFQNGSFESASVSPGGFTTLNGGSTAITGWTVLGHSIDYIGTHWAAHDGARSLDLNGNGMGGISQTFDTVANQKYLVNFWIAGNPDGLPIVKELDAGNGTVEYTFHFTFDSAGATRSNPLWSERSFEFIASGGATTLSFMSTIAGFYGPALDDVSVTAVPEPAALALFGVAIGGLGLLRGRKRG